MPITLRPTICICKPGYACWIYWATSLCYYILGISAAAIELAKALQVAPALPIKVYIISKADCSEASHLPLINFLWDATGEIAQIYAALPGTLYLIRPDGHIAAKGLTFPLARLGEILGRAAGLSIH